MKNIDKYTNYILNENNDRELLPKMVSISNNSSLTNIVCNSLINKLDSNELRDFKEWLRLIENKQTNNTGRDKYGYSF